MTLFRRSVLFLVKSTSPMYTRLKSLARYLRIKAGVFRLFRQSETGNKTGRRSLYKARCGGSSGIVVSVYCAHLRGGVWACYAVGMHGQKNNRLFISTGGAISGVVCFCVSVLFAAARIAPALLVPAVCVWALSSHKPRRPARRYIRRCQSTRRLQVVVGGIRSCCHAPFR